ncbi:MAG TPA: hypothetical protein PLQ85_11705, partial [Anaerolineae bacterium]|nr:hypothetical protein [Anaerolineae bacterium]
QARSAAGDGIPSLTQANRAEARYRREPAKAGLGGLDLADPAFIPRREPESELKFASPFLIREPFFEERAILPETSSRRRPFISPAAPAPL